MNNISLKKILTILMCAAMVVAFMPINTFVWAEDTAAVNSDVSGSKSASPTELTSKQRVTEVTLTMPSGESKHKYDIVFVMDSSSSTKNDDIDFAVYVDRLMQAVTAKDADIKVGVIKDRGRAFDTIDLASDGSYSKLVEYSSSTKDAIAAGINFTEAELKKLSSGTNMHGGLKLADEWLSDDSEVPDENKFVVLLMDGKTYIWNNEADEPTSYYTQHGTTNGRTIISKPAVGQQTGSRSKAESVFKGIDNFYFENYADLYASDNPELSNTETEFDMKCLYADKKAAAATGDVEKITITNGQSYTYPLHRDYYKFAPNGDFTGIKWFESNPYVVVDNGDGTFSYDTTQVNPNFYQTHPDSLQKGLYLTGHLWTDLSQKYNTAAITYDGWSSATGLAVAKSFCQWIKGSNISDYAADIANADDVAAMFNAIEEEIIYMVASGTVTDKIPSEFSLVKSGTDTFKLRVGGESVSAAADGSNAWNFGTANDQGVCPYRIEYDEAANSFDWIINVPIENAKQLELKYKLAIDEDAAEGLHDTNVSAVLDYVTSKGETGKYEFDIPEVSYKLEKDYTLTIYYVYSGGGTAAPTYKATLKAGASYGPIKSPSITGYKPDKASVSGVMPEGNVTVRVVYTEIPDDDDDDDDDDNPGGDNPGGGNPGGGNPGGPAAPPAGPTAGTTVPDTPAPQAAPPTTTIEDPAPPLAAGAWALINLICAILTALGAIIALFRRKEEEDEEEDEDENRNAYKAEDEEEEDDNRGKKMLAAKLAGAVAGVAAPIVFLLTEDMTLPMQLIDKWTILMVVMLAAQIVAAVFNKKASELDDEDEEEETEPAY